MFPDTTTFYKATVQQLPKPVFFIFNFLFFFYFLF
jgi:hypothetical protein